jgi:hypothetical protein
MAEDQAFFYEEKNSPPPKQPLEPGQQYKRGVAFRHENTFCAMDLNINQGIILSGEADGTLRDWIGKNFGDTNPVESECPQGIYYKRIWRPYWPGPIYRSVSQVRDGEKITESMVALRILFNKLEELFETIEPGQDNLLAYGHKTREVLLLACMEVESSWTAVLKENGYPQRPTWNTNDYVKLFRPMFLDGYKVSLRSYPHFPSFSPFEKWTVADPTHSLAWYDAYNKTKHNREDNLKLATLENAVQAVGAAVVMFYAQFGIGFGTGFMDKISPVIQSIFTILPDFKKYEKMFYISPVKSQAEGMPSLSFDWRAIDYKF